MSKWLLRGLVFATLMVIIRLLQGVLINLWESQAFWVSVVLVAVFAVAAFVWGQIDGRGDARTNPDPDRRSDLAMTWLLAGLLAGILSGFVAWFISLFYKNLYAEGLLNEVTTFAAFTALLMFVFAIGGVALGRGMVDRKAPPVQRRGADGERADTDVFEAVRDDRSEKEDSPQTAPVPTPDRGETAPTKVEERP